MPINSVLEKDSHWSSTANCYAYACDRKNPVNGANGGALPGASAGAPVLPGPNYVDRLIAGAVADGLTRLMGAGPGNPPAVHAGYLVAMVNNGNGFHWIRHDPTLDRWSWKDGNGGDVNYNIMQVPGMNYVYVKNSMLNELLVTAKNSFFWTYQSMTFTSFFSVPDSGLDVQGRP